MDKPSEGRTSMKCLLFYPRASALATARRTLMTRWSGSVAPDRSTVTYFSVRGGKWHSDVQVTE